MEKVAILTIVAISLFGVLGYLSSYLEKSHATIEAGDQDIKDYRAIGAEYERTVAVFQQQLAAANLRADSAVHQLEDMRAEKDARIAELLAIGKAYPQPTPKAPAMTVEQQVAQIRKKLAEHKIGSDNNTHRNDNPQWIEEEK